MRLSISVQGIDELLAKLSDGTVQKGTEHAHEEALALLLNRTRQRFLDQVAPDGTHWEPSYAAFLRSFNGRGGGTLFDTGTLFHSIQLYSISPTEGAIGTDVAYAKYHQFGEGDMHREFLGFSEEDENLALNVLLKNIAQVLAS